MTIDIEKNGSKAVCRLQGYLDTPASSELDRALREAAEEAEALELDLSETAYVSSAALRVFLRIHKLTAPKGGMTLTRVPPMIMGILETTGLASVLTIE